MQRDTIIGASRIEQSEETRMAIHEVRGPDPDGVWFVVEIDGDEETAIDETFATEAAAQAAADRLNA